MKTLNRIKDRVSAMIERRSKCGGRASVNSVWDFECYGKDGKRKWSERRKNKVTNEGLDALLNIMFHGSTQITTWYIGLFEDNYTPLATNTYAVPGFTESTAYDEANRVAFNEAAASSQSLSNSANKASFTISATKTIYGAALFGGGSAASTKADKAGGGTLYCASAFSSGKACEDDDVLKVTVTLTAADA